MIWEMLVGKQCIDAVERVLQAEWVRDGPRWMILMWVGLWGGRHSQFQSDPPVYLSNMGQCQLSFVCAGSMSASGTFVKAFGKKNKWWRREVPILTYMTVMVLALKSDFLNLQVGGQVQLIKHFKLVFPEPPSLVVASPAIVGALTVTRVFISGSVLATQGPLEKHCSRKASERKSANQQENKQPTFNKNRECMTHRGKHRGRHPLTASLSYFKMPRAGIRRLLTESLADENGAYFWNLCR